MLIDLEIILIFSIHWNPRYRLNYDNLYFNISSIYNFPITASQSFSWWKHSLYLLYLSLIWSQWNVFELCAKVFLELSFLPFSCFTKSNNTKSSSKRENVIRKNIAFHASCQYLQLEEVWGGGRGLLCNSKGVWWLPVGKLWVDLQLITANLILYQFASAATFCHVLMRKIPFLSCDCTFLVTATFCSQRKVIEPKLW